MDEIGYDPIIFAEQSTIVDLICSICQCVLKSPVNCPQGCEFCKSCISNYIANDTKKKSSKKGTVLCPNCKSGIFEKEKLHLCRRSRQLIERLPTKCPNSKNEFPCLWEGTVLNYEEHIANCPMEASTCAAFGLRCCFDGCNGTILRRDRDLHFEVTLPRVMDKVHEVNIQNDALWAHMSVFVAENDALKTQVSALEAEVGAHKLEVGSLRAQLSARGLETTGLSAEIVRYKAEVTALNAEVCQANTQLGSCKTRMAALENEVRDSKAEVCHAKTRVAALENEVRDSKAEVCHAKTRVAALENEVRDSKAEVCHTETRVTELKNEVRDSKAEVCGLRTQAAALLQAENVQLNKSVAVARRVSELETEVCVYKAQLNALQREVGEERRASMSPTPSVADNIPAAGDTANKTIDVQTSLPAAIVGGGAAGAAASSMEFDETNVGDFAAEEFETLTLVGSQSSVADNNNKKRRLNVEERERCVFGGDHVDSGTATALANVEEPIISWDGRMDFLLDNGVKKHGTRSWPKVATYVTSKGHNVTAMQCEQEWNELCQLLNNECKSNWNIAEIIQLYTLVSATENKIRGAAFWWKIAKQMGISPESCCAKWKNLHMNDVNPAPLTESEISVFEKWIPQNWQTPDLACWWALAKEFHCPKIHLLIRWQLYLNAKNNV